MARDPNAPSCPGCDRTRVPTPDGKDFQYPVGPGWCFDHWIWAMRNRWEGDDVIGGPRLIEMLCASKGWLLPGPGEVYTVTEGGHRYEIRRAT